MKRVLVVHPRLGSFRGARLRGAGSLLALLGIRLVLAEDAAEPEPARELARHFAERVALRAPEEVAESWALLRAWMDAHPVDAVFAQTEAGLLLGALAARHAGVRGPSPAAAHACVNKLRTRELLRAAGVPQPAFALVEDARGARRFAAERGYPLVLKAVASARQRLVTLVRSARELDGAVERLRAGLVDSPDVARLVSFARAAGVEPGCDPRRQFLVEEYAAGEPVESDGLLHGAERLPFGVIDQVHVASPDFFIEGYLFPSDRPEAECAGIERAAADALRALELGDTGYSVELRLREGCARVIEVNGRLGIDEGFGDLCEVGIGAQPVRLAAELALGRRPRLSHTGRRAALAYQCCYHDAEVTRVPDAKSLRALEQPGLTFGLNVRAGERQRAAGTGDVRPHLAHALAWHASSSREAYARARAAVDGLDIALEPRRAPALPA